MIPQINLSLIIMVQWNMAVFEGNYSVRVGLAYVLAHRAGV